MNLRERHSHTFKDPNKKERCDAAALIAAGDQMMLTLVGFHLREIEDLSAAATAVALWKKVTDGK